MKRLFWFLFLIPSLIFAQGTTVNVGQTASRISSGGSVPSSCTDGDVFFHTATTKGMYQCYDGSYHLVGSSTANGDLVGPSSAVSGNLTSFDGTSGKLTKDSGVAAADLATVNGNGTVGHCVQFSDTHQVEDAGQPCDPAGGNAVTGTFTAGRLPFASGTHSLTDYANLAYDSSNVLLSVPGTGVSTTPIQMGSGDSFADWVGYNVVAFPNPSAGGKVALGFDPTGGDPTFWLYSLATGGIFHFATPTQDLILDDDGLKLDGDFVPSVNGSVTTGNCVQFGVDGATIEDAGDTCGSGSAFDGSLIKTNPILLGPTEGGVTNFKSTTDNSLITPGQFSDNIVSRFEQVISNGQNVYGGGTNAKTTFILTDNRMTAQGAGQRFSRANTVTAYGMGDVFVESNAIQFAGADINGDEGQGFQSVSYLRQQPSLTTKTISSVTTYGGDTTTQAVYIGASLTPQSVEVGSTTGMNADDWVVVGQAVPSGDYNVEVVQVISVDDATHFTAVFRNNHGMGDVIKGATKLVLDSTSELGQDRVLVNLSGSSYSTGTVTGISGATFTGSGTTWANNMVGGAALNIGAIALTDDDYASSPFSGGSGPLKSWYQITAVTNTTHLNIFTYSVAGNTNYRGNFVTPSNYIIRPASRILRILDSTTVILEYTAATWTAGDTVENIISPYPDVTGYQWKISSYTPGGTYRDFFHIDNIGARKFNNAIRIRDEMPSGSDVDAVAWGNGVSISGVTNGINIQDASDYGIVFGSAGEGHAAGKAGRLIWSDTGGVFDPYTNGGDSSAAATLFVPPNASSGAGGYFYFWSNIARWYGFLGVAGSNAGAPATPAAGFEFFIDSGDGNKLKVVGPSGTVTLVAAP